MSLTVYTDLYEDDIARACQNGDLQLEKILQDCFPDDQALARLIRRIEALGGTREAGERTAKFAEAMKQA